MHEFNRYYVEKINFIKIKKSYKHCQFQTTLIFSEGFFDTREYSFIGKMIGQQTWSLKCVFCSHNADIHCTGKLVFSSDRVFADAQLLKMADVHFFIILRHTVSCLYSLRQMSLPFNFSCANFNSPVCQRHVSGIPVFT